MTIDASALTQLRQELQALGFTGDEKQLGDLLHRAEQDTLIRTALDFWKEKDPRVHAILERLMAHVRKRGLTLTGDREELEEGIYLKIRKGPLRVHTVQMVDDGHTRWGFARNGFRLGWAIVDPTGRRIRRV